MTYVLNFGTPSISWERLQYNTSLFIWQPSAGLKEKQSHTNKTRIQNYTTEGGRGHVAYFSNFGTPFISRERLKLETSNMACRLGDLNEIMQNQVKRGREGVT